MVGRQCEVTLNKHAAVPCSSPWQEEARGSGVCVCVCVCGKEQWAWKEIDDKAQVRQTELGVADRTRN